MADRFKKKCGRGDRNCEVVQRPKRLWLHSARYWRQGRVCPYLSRREGGAKWLPDGAKITYDVVPNKGKESAENLKVT
jgi:hypothetical protein